jgi:hypothetical protein
MHQFKRFMHEASLCLIDVVVSGVIFNNTPTKYPMFSSRVLSVYMYIRMYEYIYIYIERERERERERQREREHEKHTCRHPNIQT